MINQLSGPVPFVVYRVSDGAVLRTGTASDIDHVAMQAHGNDEVVDGSTAFVGVQADGRWFWDGTAYARGNPSLAELKIVKLTDLATIAAPRLSLWASGNLQVDDVSTGRLTSWAASALVANMTSTAFGLPYWIMADNTHHTFTGATDFLAFAQAASNYKTATIIRSAQLKIAIQGAADGAALAAIDNTQGWPI